MARQKENLEQTLEKLHTSQKQLIQSEKLASLGVFTAGIAHEINNPVNFIYAGVQALFTIVDTMKVIVNPESAGSKELNEEIEMVKNAIETGITKTTAIISSLRNYTQADDDKFVKYNSINCITDALVILENTYKNHVTIVKDFPKSVEMDCIPGKLSQIFVNLLNNAVQAIGDKGEIKIRAFINVQNEAVFSISDNGEGMEQEVIGKIFDPFYTKKEVGKGTGLGLYIVQGIVKQHNGIISVNSSPGEGSIFEIRLPVRQIAPI